MSIQEHHFYILFKLKIIFLFYKTVKLFQFFDLLNINFQLFLYKIIT
jgi:hypothetical protein